MWWEEDSSCDDEDFKDAELNDETEDDRGYRAFGNICVSVFEFDGRLGPMSDKGYERKECVRKDIYMARTGVGCLPVAPPGCQHPIHPQSVHVRLHHPFLHSLRTVQAWNRHETGHKRGTGTEGGCAGHEPFAPSAVGNQTEHYSFFVLAPASLPFASSDPVRSIIVSEDCNG